MSLGPEVLAALPDGAEVDVSIHLPAFRLFGTMRLRKDGGQWTSGGYPVDPAHHEGPFTLISTGSRQHDALIDAVQNGDVPTILTALAAFIRARAS